MDIASRLAKVHGSDEANQHTAPKRQSGTSAAGMARLF
jgi:hypothetical protein